MLSSINRQTKRIALVLAGLLLACGTLRAQSSVTVSAGSGSGPGQTVTANSNLGATSTTAVAATSTITTGTNAVVLTSGSNITFQAGSSITLEPGFQATSGSTFHAFIGAVSSYTLSLSGGSGGNTGIVAGTQVQVTAAAPPSGQAFSSWTISGPGTLANPNSATTTFTMGAGAATVTANYVSTDSTAPSVPTGLVATGTNSTTFTLSWNASTDNVGVDYYEIRRGVTSIGVAYSPTSAINNGIVAGQTYSMTVRAWDAAGNYSAWSSPLNVTIDTTPPSAPTGLVATGITPTAFDLSWNAATDNLGVDHYEIRRDVTSIGIAYGTSSAVNNGISAGNTYAMTVRAWDAAGNYSAWSSPLNVTPNASGDNTPPSVPTGLVASGITNTVFTLSWNASTDNIGVAGYEIRRDTTSIGPVTTTSAAINNGISAGNTYWMTVRAYDASSNYSDWSNGIWVTTTGGGTGQTVAISPASQTITAGQAITFTASGGQNAYSWGGSASGSGSSQTVTFNTAGTFTVTVYSQAGAGYNQSNTATATITVNLPGQTVAISPAGQTITAGQSITFTASGGQNGYAWGGSGGATGSGSTKSVTFNTAGSYTVTVYSPSGGGYAQSNTASVTIQVNSASSQADDNSHILLNTHIPY